MSDRHTEPMPQWLIDLDARIAAEDREDRRRAAQERREDRERATKGLPPMTRPDPDIVPYEGFANGGATPGA